MPPSPSPSSSSSEDDEDLSKFASCAVSADQMEKDAVVAARKRVVKAATRPLTSAARPAAAAARSAGAEHAAADSDMPSSTGLDLISTKIAAALDAILAKQLDDAGAATAAAPAAAAAAGARTPQAHPGPSTTPNTTTTAAAEADGPAGASTTTSAAAPAAAAGDVGSLSDDDGTGVQLFRAVPKGTPCVIQQDSTAAWQPSGPHPPHQQQQGGSAAGGAGSSSGFGAGSIPRQQPLREQIPRLSLAERSRRGNKRKHEAVLAALSVDGAALQVTAAAAGYACSGPAPPPPPAAGAGTATAAAAGAGSAAAVGTGATTAAAAASGGSRKVVSTTAAWVKGWKRRKGQKAPGVVVDAKEWVPYELRAAKLLGTAV